MLRQTPLLICLTLSTTLGLAQKNELELTLGSTRSSSANTTQTTTTSPGLPVFVVTQPVKLLGISNLTYGVGFARRVKDFKLAALSLEVNAAGFPSNDTISPSPAFGATFPVLGSIFLIPGARFTFLPNQRISPFVSGGAGLTHIFLKRLALPSPNALALGFGGGVDVKSPWRLVSFRTEVRDFLATQSGLGNALTVSFPSSPDQFNTKTRETQRNHLLLGGGATFHF
jgi:hypothetical protein